MTDTVILSEIYNDIGEKFSYIVRLHIFTDGFYNNVYFKENIDLDRDSSGYRPGFYISDEIMDWCFENLGAGSNGRNKDTKFYQGRGCGSINWWINWSYSHVHHTPFIEGHFKSEEDAMAFRLKWS